MVLTFDVVTAFIELLPWPAHIKNKQCIYILSNSINRQFYQKDKDIVGRNTRDLQKDMRWSKAFIKRINDADQLVLQSKQIARLPNEHILDGHGHLHVQDMIKLPLYKQSDLLQTEGILTVVHDKTALLKPKEIYKIYGTFYDTNERVTRFLIHCKVNHFFHEHPSDTQIKCLLAMIENRSFKYIAKKLFITPKAAENQITRLSYKLKGTFKMMDVVEKLRSI